MIDKLQRIEGFKNDAEKNLDGLIRLMSSSKSNLILINANSPFIVKYVLLYLKEKNINTLMPSKLDILQYGSLGGFLRSQKETKSKRISTCLVLDFCENLSNLYESDTELTDDINVNRDFFTSVFENVIIFAPPHKTYSIMRYSIDFKSCINYYIDLTKWFFSIIPLPIVKVRTLANVTSILMESYHRDKEVFLSYIELKDDISKITVYTHDIFESFIYQINRFKKRIYYYEDLFNDFVCKMISVEARKKTNEDRIDDFCKIAFHTNFCLRNVNIVIMLAEFFYRVNYLSESIACYQKAIQILIEYLEEGIFTESIISYLQCNIVICKYLLEEKHSPINLFDELLLRLSQEEELSDRHKGFMRTYLLLVSISVQHHSFAQHKDIYKRLMDIEQCNFEIMDVSETFDVACSWSRFIDNEFLPVVVDRKKTVLMETMYYIQNMVFFFSEGDYTKARNFCKKARSTAKSFGYIQVYRIVDIIWKNMKYIYKKSIMFDAIK